MRMTFLRYEETVREMFVNKIGRQHMLEGMNCQDFGMVCEGRKLVCDGCSEGAHTEVGAKAFVHLIGKGYGVREAFGKLVEVFGQSAGDVQDFLCFTILLAEEEAEGVRVSYCGDGYVILEDLEGRVTFQELSDGEYPKYFAYNYVGREFLSRYQEGVEMESWYFPKVQYRRVGVATDGLRFLFGMEEEVQREFEAAFHADREVKVKRLVNKYQAAFRDDVTIAW